MHNSTSSSCVVSGKTMPMLQQVVGCVAVEADQGGRAAVAENEYNWADRLNGTGR